MTIWSGAFRLAITTSGEEARSRSTASGEAATAAIAPGSLPAAARMS
jgi:hypothetical protein